MNKQKTIFLITMIIVFPRASLSEDKGINNPVHKFWTCAILFYNSLVDGKYQESKCRANTQYSEPPCREFFVEYEGVGGIRPGVPFKQTIEHNTQNGSSSYEDKTNFPIQSTITTIEIRKDNGRYWYAHTIVKTESKSTNRWFYNGRCSYFEAPVDEKIYLDSGLVTSR